MCFLEEAHGVKVAGALAETAFCLVALSASIKGRAISLVETVLNLMRAISQSRRCVWSDEVTTAPQPGRQATVDPETDRMRPYTKSLARDTTTSGAHR